MSGPNMRWRDSDLKTLEKEIARFNQKIYKTKFLHPELAGILPQTIKASDKKAMIDNFKASTRTEFNANLKSIGRFVERGAEKPVTSKSGITTTAWAKREVGIKVGKINRARTQERKLVEAMPVTTRGKKTGFTRGEAKSQRLDELKPKTFNFDKIKPSDWDKFQKLVSRQASASNRSLRDELYKRNYIKSIQNNIGSAGAEVIALVESLPASVVVRIYYSEQEADIEYNYSPEKNEEKVKTLMGIWSKAAGQYHDDLDR